MIFLGSVKVNTRVVLITSKFRWIKHQNFLQIGDTVKSAADRRAIGIKKLNILSSRTGQTANVQTISDYSAAVADVAA